MKELKVINLSDGDFVRLNNSSQIMVVDAPIGSWKDNLIPKSKAKRFLNSVCSLGLAPLYFYLASDEVVFLKAISNSELLGVLEGKTK